MGLWADFKLYRAWCKFKKRVKEALAMEDKAPLKSKMVWGGLVAAAIPLWAAVAKYISLDPELANAITAMLTAIATALGITGARGVLGGIKKAAAKSEKRKETEESG
jgi:hypothetical protein